MRILLAASYGVIVPTVVGKIPQLGVSNGPGLEHISTLLSITSVGGLACRAQVRMCGLQRVHRQAEVEQKSQAISPTTCAAAIGAANAQTTTAISCAAAPVASPLPDLTARPANLALALALALGIALATLATLTSPATFARVIAQSFAPAPTASSTVAATTNPTSRAAAFVSCISVAVDNRTAGSGTGTGWHAARCVRHCLAQGATRNSGTQ